jgi:threonine synthase
MAWLNDKLRLRCVRCGKEYPWSFSVQCAPCENALIDVDYNLEKVKIGAEGTAMQRYFDLLPVLSRDFIIDGGEGNTPCFHAKELGAALGIPNLYIKDETKQPTRSTKARQGPVGIAGFRNLGIAEFVTSSTGNSSTSLARIVSQFPDMRMHLFVGDEFLKRVNWVGAKNVIVYWLKNGSFVDAHNAAKWFANTNQLLSARGFFYFGQRESLKTVFLEAVDQVPKPVGYYLQSISSALGVHAVYKGAKQYLELGRIPRLPRLVCVQEETCNPMVRAWESGAETMGADHIVKFPRGLSKSTLRGDSSLAYPYIREAVKDTGGTMVTATQDEMRAARKQLLELEGIDACYTSSMTVVAAKNLAASNWFDADALVLLNISGADRKGEPYPAPDFVVEKDGENWRITPTDSAEREGCLDKVLRVVSGSLKLPAETELDTETKLIGGGLAVDSVGLLELSLALEKEFGCEVSEAELNRENFETVGHIADMFRQKLSEGALAGN